MPSGSASTSAANGGTGDDFNALVIGSGLSGLYMLFRLRQLNVPTTVLEQAPDVGGTWWWNAYPGARFDSESYSYAMSFGDPDDPNGILQEFNWTERFAGQNETLGFINRICEKYDLKKDVQFNSRVVAARFLEDEGKWEVTLESGETKTARFLISAVGVLSAPVMPLIGEVCPMGRTRVVSISLSLPSLHSCLPTAMQTESTLSRAKATTPPNGPTLPCPLKVNEWP